jgi:hypothetical protein
MVVRFWVKFFGLSTEVAVNILAVHIIDNEVFYESSGRPPLSDDYVISTRFWKLGVLPPVDKFLHFLIFSIYKILIFITERKLDLQVPIE